MPQNCRIANQVIFTYQEGDVFLSPNFIEMVGVVCLLSVCRCPLQSLPASNGFHVIR